MGLLIKCSICGKEYDIHKDKGTRDYCPNCLEDISQWARDISGEDEDE